MEIAVVGIEDSDLFTSLICYIWMTVSDYSVKPSKSSYRSQLSTILEEEVLNGAIEKPLSKEKVPFYQMNVLIFRIVFTPQN